MHACGGPYETTQMTAYNLSPYDLRWESLIHFLLIPKISYL
jgi:hypothetical protein